jgi:hypothetical protein
MNGPEEYLVRYANKVGLQREKISHKNLDDIRSVKVFVILGELAQTVFFAKTVYDYEIADEKSYNIVISWNGLRCFFGKSDEFWYLGNSNNIDELYRNTDGINNESKLINVISRSLNEVFFNVKHAHEYNKYFKSYLTDEFILKYPDIKISFPSLLSRASLPNFFNEKLPNLPKNKIVIMPFKKSISFQYGKNHIIDHYEFLYQSIIRSFLTQGIGVVCVQNDFTFDLSLDLQDQNLLFIKEHDFQKITTICHVVGSYIDYFGNSLFVGALAQAKCLSIMERLTWFEGKKIQEFEIYKSGRKIKNYFSFLNFNNMDDHTLNVYYCNNIISCLNQFFDERQDTEKFVIKQKNVNFSEIIKLTTPKFFGKLLKIKGLKNAEV